MEKIFALIPARSGSKGVPNKNIRKLGGHSLIKWAINVCKKSALIDDIYFSSDSENYCKEAIRFGAKAPFLRPKEISGDSSSDYEMVNHALSWFEQNAELPRLIVHIRPTSPLRDPLVIDQAITTFLENPNRTALRSIHEMSESAYKSFEISQEDKLVSFFEKKNDLDSSNKPRQMFPKTYAANGYVDILSTDHIIKNKTIHGNNVLPFITSKLVEVDSEDDFSYLSYIIAENQNIIKKIFG